MGGTCGATIIANCSLVVTFSPAAAGNFSDAITLNYSNGTDSQQVSQAITGQAQNPALLSLSPNSSFDFGTIALNYPVTQTFVLSNIISGIAANDITITGLSAPFSNSAGCGNARHLEAHAHFQSRSTPHKPALRAQYCRFPILTELQ